MGILTATAGAVRHGRERAGRRRPRSDTAPLPRVGRLSAVDLTTPNPDRAGEISTLELEIPQVAAAPRVGRLSAADLLVPDVVVGSERIGQVSVLEFDTPTPPRVGRLSAMDFEIGDPAKPKSKGMFTRESVPAVGSAYDVGTITIWWSDVESTQGVYDFSSIDADLATAASRGVDSLRFRIFTGVRAPGWAKAFGNGPIDYIEPQGGTSATIPDLWNEEYKTAVQALYDALAAEYDANPNVSLVFAAGAMTYYAEPFIRGLSNASNRANFLAAGYTRELDQELQLWQLDIMDNWATTPIGLAYNAHNYINASGGNATDLPYMGVVMDYHIEVFGSRTVLQNNSIRDTYIASPPAMYDYFVDRPTVSHQFQLAAASRVGDEAATIEWAISFMNASGIETAGKLTTAQYNAYDPILQANL